MSNATATRPVPALRPPVPATPPEILDTLLDNGLRLVAARLPAVPVAQVRLFIPFGGEDAMHAATAEVLAATLLAGAAGLPREEIDAVLADAGATVKVTVGPELLRITAQVLADGLPDLLGVLARCLASAAYQPETVAAEQRRVLDRVRLAESLPAYAARAALLRHCFGDHPVTRETPAHADVAAVTAGQVARLHATQVVPAGSVLVVVGDVAPDRLAGDALASWPATWSTPGTARRMAPLPALAGGAVAEVARPGARQTEVRLLAPALPRTDPDFAALYLAGQVFGGSFSARLVQHLRERLGFIYSGYSAIEERAGSGLTTVQFACAPANTAAALAEAMAELAAVSGDRPPTDEEVAAARGHALGLRSIALATQAGLADTLATVTAAGLEHGWLARYEQRLRTVPAEQVRAAAARYLRPDQFAGVTVGPVG